MSDIVERLRASIEAYEKTRNGDSAACRLLRDCDAEITRLRAEKAKATDLAEALEAICIQFPDDDVLRECSLRTGEDDDGDPVHRHWAQKILAARAALAKASGETS